MPTALRNLKGRIGLALGSGAARGWAHVGVIRALVAAGIVPEVVCGTSSGAVVGALYAANRLDAFEAWGRQLDWRQVMGYFDLTFRGGLIKARKLFDRIAEELPQDTVDALELPFAAVATDLETGREVWLRDTALVDGGVVNPVPISLCRAMGADSATGEPGRTTRARVLFAGQPAGDARELRRRPAPAHEHRRLSRRRRTEEPHRNSGSRPDPLPLRGDREQPQHHAGAHHPQPHGG